MNIVGPRTLRHELTARVQAAPNKTWLLFEERPTADAAPSVRQSTYAEFERQVQRTANVLVELGLRPGDKLVLHLGNCPEFLFLWFGAALCGAVIVPTNTLSSLDELEYLTNHS